MEALDKKERVLLDTILSDKKAMDNFLRDSNNPRFLPYLNGRDDKKLDIFKEGFLPDDKRFENARFLSPSLYLLRISEKFKKETNNIAPKTSMEYEKEISKALGKIITGYSQDLKNGKKSFVSDNIIKITENLGFKYINAKFLAFIDSALREKQFDMIIWQLQQILESLIREKNKKIEKLLLTIIKRLPDSRTSGDAVFYSELTDLLAEKNGSSTLGNFCSENFILTIANFLSKLVFKKYKRVIENKIEMHVLKDSSIEISIRKTNIKFNLPYVEFSDKETQIVPIIREQLAKLNDPKKERVIAQIAYFYTEIWADTTRESYPSLNNEPKIFLREKESVLIYILKEIMLTRLRELGIDNFKNLYNKITGENKSFIFKRILLYCYGKEFKQYKKLLFELLEKEKGLIFSGYFEAEIYNIMEENCANFDEEDIERVSALIEEGPYNKFDWFDNDIDVAKYAKHWKQSQYAPLVKIPKFMERYNSLRQETGQKEFFNFRDGFEFHSVDYKSPFEDTEALSLIGNNPSKYIEMAESLYKKGDSLFASVQERACAEGMADQLQGLARNYPQKLIQSLGNLTELQPLYIEHILYGLRDTSDKPNILWNEIFKFLGMYIDKNKEDYKRISNIIFAFADIVPTEDSIYFKIESGIGVLHNFIGILLTKYEYKNNRVLIGIDKQIPWDYLNDAINTSMGRALEKFVILVLKSEKPENKEKIKSLYVQKLLPNNIMEGYVFLGLYYAHFYRMDKKWLEEKANSILSAANGDNLQYWEMFFEGFVKSNIQYLDYYDWMHSHYKKAIEIYAQSNEIRFTDLLTQFFIAGKDTLKEYSLLSYAYEKGRFELLSGCIHAIAFKINKGKYTGRQPTAEEQKEEDKVTPKAQQLWEFIWGEIDINKLNSYDDKFMTNILDLIPALERLDDDSYKKIHRILVDIKPKINDVDPIFNDLLYLVNKPGNDDSSVKYLGEIYVDIIEYLEYFYKEDPHKKIIDTLKSKKSKKQINRVFEDIKAIYIKKGWNNSMPWFD